MNTHKLGNTDLQVSQLCFGGNVFGWTIDEAMSFKLLDALTDGGINFVDTADVYSAWAHNGTGGQSETIIGKWLKRNGQRDKVIIATKVGMEMAPDKKGLSARILLKQLKIRCAACKPITSTCTNRMLTTRIRHCRKRWKPTQNW